MDEMTGTIVFTTNRFSVGGVDSSFRSEYKNGKVLPLVLAYKFKMQKSSLKGESLFYDS